MAANSILRFLCVCFANGCRSPMMAALLEQELGRYVKIEVDSAGVMPDLQPGGPASENSVQVMQEMGLDISGHQRRRADSLDLNSYDQIFCTGQDIADKLIELGADSTRISVWETPNPYQQGIEVYRACARSIRQKFSSSVHDGGLARYVVQNQSQ